MLLHQASLMSPFLLAVTVMSTLVSSLVKRVLVDVKVVVEGLYYCHNSDDCQCQRAELHHHSTYTGMQNTWFCCLTAQTH